MKATSDELTLKSILSCWRGLTIVNKEGTLSIGLASLLQQDGNEDFFTNILAL